MPPDNTSSERTYLESARLVLLLAVLLNAETILAQNFQLLVQNGYGSGAYRAGDTVHVWSEAHGNDQTFDTWTGDTAALVRPREWHTTLVMPRADLTIEARLRDLPAYTLELERICGAQLLKNVYAWMPPQPRGLIFFFHGTGGSASGWVSGTENRSLVNAAIAAGYGVLVTEAEEITLNEDTNGDGKLRWDIFPIDTVNGIDYRILRALTDTFIRRGLITSATPRYAIGMSNGGAFASAASAGLGFAGGVSYCASSAEPIFRVRQSPFAFRMAKFDENPEVGPKGNREARAYAALLSERKVCSDYLLRDRQPVHPERFARIGEITIERSAAIHNELRNNGQINAAGFAINSQLIAASVQARPGLYPSIVSLRPALQREVLAQLASANAEHQFYSDLNAATLRFFSDPCAAVSVVAPGANASATVRVYPNPVTSRLHVETPCEGATVSLVSALGVRTNAGLTADEIDLSDYPAGVYYLSVACGGSTRHLQIVKQ